MSLHNKGRQTWMKTFFKVNHPSLIHGHNPSGAHWNFIANPNVWWSGEYRYIQVTECLRLLWNFSKCLKDYKPFPDNKFQTLPNLNRFRQQFRIWQKWWKVLWKGRKLCGEKEKLLIRSNFSFSHRVFKRLVLQTCESKGLHGKGIMLWFLAA